MTRFNPARSAARGALGMVPLVLLMAGCSGGLKSDAPVEQIYVLHAAAPAVPVEGAVAGVLVVPRPFVHPGLDSDRIALSRAGNQLEFYARSRWGASLPRVIGALAVEAAQGSFGSVLSGDQVAARGDYELLLTVRHFEADYAAAGAAPQVHVAIDCLLSQGSPRRILGSCSAEVQQSATENRLGPVVAALEAAAQLALNEVTARAAGLIREAAAIKK
jgi:ABC-type uncharacterized transport system auxiliary subunit